MISCQFLKIFKNTFFIGHLVVASCIDGPVVEEIWRFFNFFCASLGGAPSFWFSTLPVFGAMDLVNVEIKRFGLTRDHVIDVSRDFVDEVLSS